MDELTDGFRVSWTLVNQVVAVVEKKSSPGKCKSLARQKLSTVKGQKAEILINTFSN